MDATELSVLRVLVWAMTLEVVASIVSAVYIVLGYLERRGDSPLYRDVVLMAVAGVTVGLVLLAPAIVAAAGLPRLPYTAIVVVAAVMVLLSPPILLAVRFWKLRRRNGGDHHG